MIKLSKLDRAELLEEIVETMAMETCKHVDIIINEVARHYGITEKKIVDLLKSINSKFVNDTNRIVGYIDGEPLKRTTYHMACKRIFEKLVTGFRKNDLFDPTDQNHINFLTESTYCYFKNCDKIAAQEV
jgi:uncharacterized protein (UPF0297 family)